MQFTRNGRFSPYEAPAGNCLYYQKGDVQVSELWRVPVGGGDRRQVLASAGDRRFAVQSDGIYFFAWARYRSMASLQFVRSVSGKTKKIDEIEGPFLFYEFALTISADGRPVLCTHPERPNSGLLVVEDSQ